MVEKNEKQEKLQNVKHGKCAEIKRKTKNQMLRSPNQIFHKEKPMAEKR